MAPKKDLTMTDNEQQKGDRGKQPALTTYVQHTWDSQGKKNLRMTTATTGNFSKGVLADKTSRLAFFTVRSQVSVGKTKALLAERYLRVYAFGTRALQVVRQIM